MTYHQNGLNIYDMIEYIQNFRSKITTPENTKKKQFQCADTFTGSKKTTAIIREKKAEIIWRFTCYRQFAIAIGAYEC